jgi:folylpolyglutamate synthase/dihydropteroate synthase
MLTYKEIWESLLKKNKPGEGLWKFKIVLTFSTVESAVKWIYKLNKKSSEELSVFVTGSLHLVGNFIKFLKEKIE